MVGVFVLEVDLTGGRSSPGALDYEFHRRIGWLWSLATRNVSMA